MPPKGTFPDGDPSVVVDLVDRKVLRPGIVGMLFRRIDGVVIRPSWPDGGPRRSMRKATKAGVPQASISKTGLVKKSPTVFLVPPDGMTQDQAQARVAAAGLDGPEVRTSFGQHLYDFPADTSGAPLVEFALAALRALGAEPTNGQWEYFATQPAGE